MKHHTYKRILSIVVICLCLMLQVLPAAAHAADGTPVGGVCGDNLTWSLENGVLTITGSGAMTDYEDGFLPPWYDRREEITAVALPDGLTSVGDLAFFGCANLKTAAIPAHVTRIGSDAFAECTGLLTVSFPSGLETIWDSAFRECKSLTAIRLPDTLTSIGSQSFYRCYGLTLVTVPASVTRMGKQVFAYCTNLVQATVNASLTVLPDWTFYGCTSLSSVTLSASMTVAGEYALKGCDSLNAVYTQSYDTVVADQIQESMGKGGNGYVATYDPPSSSITAKTDGSQSTSTQVTETANSIITVTETTSSSEAPGKTQAAVAATVENSSGWTELSESVSQAMDAVEAGRIDELDVSVQMTGTIATGADLNQFAGESITLDVTTSTGINWEIDMEQAAPDSFSGTYDLGITVTHLDSKQTALEAESVYQVSFADSTDFKATVGIPLTVGQAYQTATLYQKNGFKLQELQTVVVDANGSAWFYLDGTDSGTKYYVGVNAPGANAEEAIIPQALQAQYGGLMDSNGVEYVITGRSSRWGITGGRFAIYVAVAVAAVVLVVAIVMISLNKISQSKAQYAAMAAADAVGKGRKTGTGSGEEEPIDKDALRLQIMQEMLEKMKKNKG